MVSRYPIPHSSLLAPPATSGGLLGLPTGIGYDKHAEQIAMLSRMLLGLGQGIGTAPNFGAGLVAGLNDAGVGMLDARRDYRTGVRERQQLAEDEAAQKQREAQAKLWAQIAPTWGAPTTDTAAAPSLLSPPPPAGAPSLLSPTPPTGSSLLGNVDMQRLALSGLDPETGLKLFAERAFADPRETWSPMSSADEIAAFGRDLPGAYYASSIGSAPKLIEGSTPAGIKIETIDRGGNQDQGYFATPGDPKSWVSLGTAPRWQPPQLPSTVGVVTLRMPNGSLRSFANTDRPGIEQAIGAGAVEAQGETGQITPAQIANNAEIDAARKRIRALGMDATTLLGSMQKQSDTGMDNPSYSPQVAHDVSLAMSHKVGTDAEFMEFQNLFMPTVPGPGVGLPPGPDYGQPGGDMATAPPPQAAVDYLRQHPELRAAFDAKYGTGSAARYLIGGR